MWFVLQPGEACELGFCIGAGLDEAAIGKRDHAFGKKTGDFRSEFFVGGIKTGEPMASFPGFSLGKEMRLAFLVAHGGSAKIHALLRLGMMLDFQSHLLISSQRFFKIDKKLSVGNMPMINA